MASSSTSTDSPVVEQVAPLSLQQVVTEGIQAVATATTSKSSSDASSSPVVVAYVHLLNGNEIILEDINLQTETVDGIQWRIHESDKESFPHPQRLWLFIGEEELLNGKLTLATYLSHINATSSTQRTICITSEMIDGEGKPLEDTAASSLPRVIHLGLIFGGPLRSVILFPEQCDQLIEWIQEKRGKRVTGTTLLMRGSEVSSMIIFCVHPSCSSVLYWNTHTHVHTYTHSWGQLMSLVKNIS